MYIINLTRRRIRIGIVRPVLCARTWIIRIIHGLRPLSRYYIVVRWGWTRSWVIVISKLLREMILRRVHGWILILTRRCWS